MSSPCTPPITLSNIAIATPCHASWENMVGDDQSRHCKLCDKTVYNLSQFSQAAANRFLAEQGHSACIRLYRRPDGTFLTADCNYRKLSRASVQRPRRWLALGVVVALNLAACKQQPPANAQANQAGPSSMQQTEPLPVLMGAPATPGPEDIRRPG